MNGEKEEEQKKFNMQLITRNQPTSDENPPWVGISFTEPVDSDTLAEQLRKKYPHGRTLRERKHMAAIDFLKDELSQMQSKSSPLTISAENLKIAESSYSRPPRSGSEFEGMPAENSRRESVSTCDTPESSLHLSVVVDQNKQSLERSPSADNVPISSSSATAGQQFVFSAVDLHPRQPKTKRKMTTEERTAYKETRKRGACLKCRRQKGRCTHNINDALTEPISPVEPQHRIQRPTAMDPISPVMVQNGTKRRNSASPGPEPLDHTKVLKFEHTSDIRQSSPSDPQPPVHHHNHHSSIQMRESTISGQMRPVPGDGQRGGTASSDQSAIVSPSTTSRRSTSPSSSNAPTPTEASVPVTNDTTPSENLRNHTP